MPPPPLALAPRVEAAAPTVAAAKATRERPADAAPVSNAAVSALLGRRGALPLPPGPVPRGGQDQVGNGAVAAARQAEGPTEPAAPDRRPGPHADPKFVALKKDVQHKKRTVAGSHPPPKAEAGAAQDAARPPKDDEEAQGKTANAEKMNEAKPKEFDKAAFIAAVEKAIEAKTPKNLEQADDFAGSGKPEEIKADVQGQVGTGKKDSAEEISATTAAPPDTSGAVAKKVVPMAPDRPPGAPAAPDAADAVPDKLPPSATDLSAGPAKVDRQLADAHVTETQLRKSNEPVFTGALDDKKAAERDSEAAPGRMRKHEAQQLQVSTAQAKRLGTAAMGAMGAKRVAAGQRVGAGKSGAKSRDEAKRAEITARLQSVFDTMKTDVEGILHGLDKLVDDQFTRGEKQARAQFTVEYSRRMIDYKRRRYGGPLGAFKWAGDKLFGLPDEVNQFYDEARAGYVQRMKQVISDVATTIGTELNRAKKRIAQGRSDIQAEVKRLPEDLRAIGREAAEGFAEKFDELAQEVDDKGTELVDTLATKYTDALKAVDDQIAEEKEKNKGLVTKAVEAIKSVIDTILELGRLLLAILAKAAQAVGAILGDPVGFLGNLVSAVGAGLRQFMRNIGTHLQQGILSWLLGKATEAGLQLPDKFDTRGVLTLLAGLLGLTPQAIWARISRRLPPQAAAAAETAVPLVAEVRRRGITGMWDDLRTRIGDLRKTLLDKVIEYVTPTIVIAGITWVISLLNPASAFVRAVKLIIDIVRFVVTQARQIFDFVNAVLDAVIAIARGGAGGVPGLIERALAKAIPVLLGFLASLLGLGGIADKVKKIVQALAKPVGKAIDWVIDKIVGLVKAAWRKLKAKLGRKKKPKRPRHKRPDGRKPRIPRKPRKDPRDTPHQAAGHRKPDQDAPVKGAVATALREAMALARPGASVTGIDEGLKPIKRKYKLKQLSLIIDRFGPTKTTLRFAGVNSPEEKSGPVNLWHKSYDGIRHLVELTKGIPQLVVKRTPLDESVEVELLTFKTGEKAVRKVPVDDSDIMHLVSPSERRVLRTGHDRADAERLGAAVSRAVGAPVPAAFRYSQTEVLMDYAEGRRGLLLPEAEQERLMASERGRRIGLLDVLIGNPDRNPGNYVVLDGKVTGIDQGEAWSEAGKELSGWTYQTFGKAYYDFARNEWRKNDLSRSEVERLQAALEALRPEFLPSRQEWYDDMMKRFAEVKKQSRWGE
ncbi:hypothetical protein AB0J55_16605 [Amycolatopsis sp. NPDC049688]|uniref:hypothetical protein n=1 Tax=Amycolatopsis sp. NPDC049688 TaxID=3154733 RepID=UPI0034160D71